MALTIFNQEAYDEFQLDLEEISKATQRVIKENDELKKRQAEAKAKGEEYKPKGSFQE